MDTRDVADSLSIALRNKEVIKLIASVKPTTDMPRTSVQRATAKRRTKATKGAR